MRYMGLRIVSLLYGVVGWILLVGGIVLAIFSSVAAKDATAFFFILAIVLVYALIFLGTGQFLRMLLDIESNLRRAEEATSKKTEF